MLEIQEKFDTSGYEDIIKSPDTHITEALDRGKPIGFIAYSYGTEKTAVYDFDDGGDITLCDGLIRSVMLKSIMKNIEVMTFELDSKTKYDRLKKLGFLSDESKFCENLSRFMNACESCRDKNKQKGAV